MPRNWQKIDWQHDWGGLVDRRQTLDHPIAAASIAKNVELYGGPVGKRLGSQYMNGWGAICQAGWDDTEGDVDDASGFDTTDTLYFYYADGTEESASISTIVSNTITLTGALSGGAPSQGMAVIAKRSCGSDDRIDGLFQANFRDGTKKLLAAADDTLYTIPALAAGAAPAAVTRDLPSTTVAATWGGSFTTGTLTTTETLVVDDQITIDGEDTVVTDVTPSTNTIVVSPALGSSPTGGETVVFHPTRVAGDTHFVQHANITHIVTDTTTPGDSPPVKYLDDSGYEIQRHGVRPPTHSGTAPTAVAGSATGLTGVYKYVFKFYDSNTGQESDAGPVITSPSLSNEDCELNDLPISPDPQVDKKRIYRSTSGGAGVFYYLDEIDNAETDYDGAGGNPGPDSTADTGLGAQMRDLLDTTIPDAIGIITLWPQANRLIGINTSTGAIVFSDQIDLAAARIKSEAWPTDNFFFINYDDGDKPRAVVAFYDSVMVFKERSSFRVKGTPPNITIEPVVFRQDLTSVGAFNQKGIVVDQNEMIFPAEDGMYQINRYEGDQAGFETRRVSRQIDKRWGEINAAQVQLAHGVFFRERRQYRLFIPRGTDTEPKDMEVYQFEGSIQGVPYGWTYWDMTDAVDGGIEVSASCVGRGTPDKHYIGTATGDVIQMDYAYADRGAFAYQFEYAPVWFAPAGKGMPARGRALDLALSIIASTTLNVYVETDFAGAIVNVSVPLTAVTGFTLGTSQLDVDSFAKAELEQALGIILIALGEYHRLRFVEYSNVGHFYLQNWTYWFQALPVRTKTRAFVQDKNVS